MSLWRDYTFDFKIIDLIIFKKLFGFLMFEQVGIFGNNVKYLDLATVHIFKNEIHKT